MKIPSWFSSILGGPLPDDGGCIQANGVTLVRSNGVFRAEELASEAQRQTRETFGFKWQKRETYEGTLAATAHSWLLQRYGDVAHAEWLSEYGERPLLLDAGCGAAFSALELWGDALPRLRYVGADISEAVDVARARFAERGLEGAFIQSDLQRLPLAPESIDLIFSEGVLHHCDDTRTALTSVVSYLRPGGRILFYVYKTKGPIREFTDDYIRERLRDVPPEQAWDLLMSLSKLGQALGKLNVEIDVPEDVALLGIPKGRIDLQRFVYWHVFKAFHHPDMNLDELNHVNYDWYTPQNAHRQTPDQVRQWSNALGLVIEREVVEDAGITIIARKDKK